MKKDEEVVIRHQGDVHNILPPFGYFICYGPKNSELHQCDRLGANL